MSAAPGRSQASAHRNPQGEATPVSLMDSHPFDRAIALRHAGANLFAGECGPQYWNMVGPFGGVLAAMALNAVLRHPDLRGEPVALTVNYAAALAQGRFTISARPARTNRSTQHWIVELVQDGAAGASAAVLTATIMTAVRRSTWGAHDLPMPPVAQPLTRARAKPPGPIAWLSQYEIRFLEGSVPRGLDDTENPASGEATSLTQMWARDDPPRPLDFCSLASMADLFFPRLFLRRRRRVPVGTVSMTTYFHTNASQLRDCGTGYVLGQARGQVYHDGFFDHTAQLWSESGVPLATSSQIVYYKE